MGTAKWIAGLLGWVAFGPIGALLGVIAGSVIEGAVEAALDREGLQTMRTLANNMAALLKATGGKPMPGSDEPWDGMHFIR